VAEALAGSSSLVSLKGPSGPRILALEPIRNGQTVVGTISAGTLVGQRFAKILAREVGVDLSLLDRSGAVVASSAAGPVAADNSAVVAAFQQKIPIYRSNEATHTTMVYMPILVVDEAWVVMAALDSKSAYALLKQGDERAALFNFLLAGGAMLITLVILRLSLKPLRELRVRAEQSIGEITGTTKTVSQGDDIASVIGAIDSLTASLLSRNRELDASEQRFRTLIEWSHESIAVHREGKLLYVNPAAIEILGAQDGHNLIGRSIHEFIHPEFREKAIGALSKLDDQTTSTDIAEGRFITLDGRTLDAEVRSTSIVYDGESAFYTSVRDVTARKQAETALIASEERWKFALEGAGDGLWD
jgi:PAS domain S-box-containing protein